MSTVTIRQTLDPYVEDVQYIASYETTLTPDGKLDLSTIGIKFEPHRFFLITTHGGLTAYIPSVGTNIFSASFVKKALSYNPILTIVEVNDHAAACDRHCARADERRRAEQIEYVKGLFGHVGSRILSAFGPLTATHDHATHTTQMLQGSNTSTHDDPRLERFASATATSSHIPTTSILVNRRLGDGDGY